MKLLTVIVPSYNMEDYLPRCLQSLIVSDGWLVRLEVLVVNDGSSDRTSEIAHQYSTRYPETFVTIDKENGHYGSCVNAGLKQATGRYVKLLDADDYFDVVELEAFLEGIERLERAGEQVDVLLSDFDVVNKNGVVTAVHRYVFPRRAAFGMGTYNGTRCDFFTPKFAYRTEMLRNIGYCQTEHALYTDLEWQFYPMSNALRLLFVPVNLYRYVIGREGQSVNPAVIRRNVNARVIVVQKMLKWFARYQGQMDFEHTIYVERFLLHQVGTIYQTCLIDNASMGNADEVLGQIDRCLLEYAPEIYEKSERNFISRFFKFHYVWAWRRLTKFRHLYFLLLRFYYVMLRWVVSVRGYCENICS